MSNKPTILDDAGQACVPCLIDGEPVVQPSAASFPIVSARTQQTLHYGQTATVEIATRAVESAAAAFKKYRKTNANERRHLLERAADLFEQRVPEAMERQIAETSCLEHWAQFNAHGMSLCVKEYAVSVKSAVSGEITPSQSGATQLVTKEPVGPVLIIVPWNGALILCVRGIAAALAAGCTVILKASELCPWTHTFAAQTFLDAGFPPGSVNVVMADRSSAADVTEAIIGHSSLRKVEFIGSAAVGKSIGAVAAKYLKPTLMELGDQSPAIIMKGADLKSAADVCAKGALALHGQVCFSFERIIVQSSIMNEFCQHLKAAFDNTPISGFAVSNASAEKAKAVIDDAIQRGAKLIYGDNKLTSPAALSPSILVDVPHDALISQHEAFAPTVFIATVETEQEAIDEANSREGGLFCSVFTERQDRGWSMAKELDFGMVQVNPKEVILDLAGPMTGWKASGWGSHAGKYGINLFLQDKIIVL